MLDERAGRGKTVRRRVGQSALVRDTAEGTLVGTRGMSALADRRSCPG
jgi:hypothetical protein